MELNTQYEQMVAKLLPMGPAWSDAVPIMQSLAFMLTKTHHRIDDVMREIDPKTSVELLERYETICQLPDSCYSDDTNSLTERQSRLDGKVNLIGGLDEQFFLSVLAANGYQDATISRYIYSEFSCESTCVDSVYGYEWLYYWIVNLSSTSLIQDMSCSDDCISPLRKWGDTQIECIIDKLCPSHTFVIFKYGALNA